MSVTILPGEIGRVPLPGAEAGAGRQEHSPALRRALLSCDAVATAAAWVMVLQRHPELGLSPAWVLSLIVALTATSLALLGAQQLYLRRVCQVRSVELARIGRAALLMGLAFHLLTAAAGGEVSFSMAIEAALFSFVLLAVGRRGYAWRLGRRRRRGLSCQRVIIVGRNAEAHALQALLRDNAGMGLIPVAMVPAEEVGPALELHGARSVLVAVSAMDQETLNCLVRQLLDAGVHVQLSCGLAGFDYRRLRPSPVAHEPLFYLEPLTASNRQQVGARLFDIVGATVALLLSSPLLLLAAAGIKLQDRGPVLFRQERIGRGNRPFTLYKLRTMVPNADGCLAAVAGQNRRTGPLFKADHDPRVTPLGRFLRATSIDELPQLFNVLNGTMSLVGPRPALAHEVSQFDQGLLARHRVRPGMTGLWQVEARHDPSFDAYRRLDLFYVENWSLMLDAIILFRTVSALVGQAVSEFRRQWTARPLCDSVPQLDQELGPHQAPVPCALQPSLTPSPLS